MQVPGNTSCKLYIRQTVPSLRLQYYCGRKEEEMISHPKKCKAPKNNAACSHSSMVTMNDQAPHKQQSNNMATTKRTLLPKPSLGLNAYPHGIYSRVLGFQSPSSCTPTAHIPFPQILFRPLLIVGNVG